MYIQYTYKKMLNEEDIDHYSGVTIMQQNVEFMLYPGKADDCLILFVLTSRYADV